MHLLRVNIQPGIQQCFQNLPNISFMFFQILQPDNNVIKIYVTKCPN